MVVKSIVGAACTCLVVASLSANAALISADWKMAGDNLITQDTDSGLEWLNLLTTSGRSYGDISTKFGVNEEFEGWRYASQTEVQELTRNWGIPTRNTIVGGDPYDIPGFANFLGDTFSLESGLPMMGIPSIGVQGFVTLNSDLTVLSARYRTEDNRTETTLIGFSFYDESDFSYNVGSWLVRDNASIVPIPASILLFGSGLLGLIGFASRKK